MPHLAEGLGFREHSTEAHERAFPQALFSFTYCLSRGGQMMKSGENPFAQGKDGIVEGKPTRIKNRANACEECSK